MEGVQNEIKISKQKEAEEEAAFDKFANGARDNIAKASEVIARLDREKQDAEEEEYAQTNERDDSDGMLTAAVTRKGAIDTSCTWVHDGTFENRKQDRTTELEGLRAA